MKVLVGVFNTETESKWALLQLYLLYVANNDCMQIMALEESCLACGPGDQQHQHHEPKDEIFHRNYKRWINSELYLTMLGYES